MSPNIADNSLVTINNFMHPLFNRRMIIFLKASHGEIIIKAIFDCWPNGDLRFK